MTAVVVTLSTPKLAQTTARFLHRLSFLLDVVWLQGKFSPAATQQAAAVHIRLPYWGIPEWGTRGLGLVTVQQALRCPS